MRSSTKVVVNMAAQYARTIINMILGLYSTRLVLQILGVDDFGIFSLVAGVVSMLSFVTSALAGSTQRYLSYYQGTKDIKQIQGLFNNCIVLHILVGILVVIVFGSFLPVLFNGFLNIADDRLFASKILYCIVIVNLFVSFNTAPYRALVIAHENIVYTSIVEVLDAVIKLVLVFCLQFIHFDKLVGYGFVVFAIQLFEFLALFVYSHLSYAECIYPKINELDKGFLKEFSSFTGWTMYNSACSLGRTQGVAIIINKFFNTATNAAYGIATSVLGYVSMISQALKTAIAPQIVRSEGGGNRDRMLWLSAIESKMTFLLISALGIPVMFEIEPILTVWLGNVPRYAGVLCCMKILTTMVDMLTTGLSTANLATGKLKDFSLYVYSIKLLTIPFAILSLYIYNSIIVLVTVYVVVELVGSLVRIPFMVKNAGLDGKEFCQRVFPKVLPPALLSCMVCWGFISLFDFKFRFIVTVIVSFAVLSCSTLLWGLCEDEKQIVKGLLARVRD